MLIHYKAAHVLTQYEIWNVALPYEFYYMGRGCKNIHLHHYTLMMIILSLLSYQDAFTTLLSGYFNGVMIEGAANYGYDPIFERGDEAVASVSNSEIRAEQEKARSRLITIGLLLRDYVTCVEACAQPKVHNTLKGTECR